MPGTTEARRGKEAPSPAGHRGAQPGDTPTADLLPPELRGGMLCCSCGPGSSSRRTHSRHPSSLPPLSLPPCSPLPPCFPSQGATALLFPSLSLNPPACVMLTWAQGYLWGDHRLHGAQPHSTPTQAPYGGGGQRRWRAGWVWALPTLKNPSDTSLTKPQVKDENKDFKMEAAIKLLPPCRATGPVTGLVTHPGGQS